MWGDGRVERHGPGWRVQYFKDGRRYREGGFKTEAEAKRYLRKRVKEIYSGRFAGPIEERRTVNDIVDAYLDHLELKGAKSLASTQSHARHLHEAFGHDRAVDITTDELRLFMKRKLGQGKARATVNRLRNLLRSSRSASASRSCST